MHHDQELWLVRHGETAWSRTGQHTGRTDIPLIDEGRDRAITVGRLLARREFDVVLSSPLERARETCRLAGFGGSAVVDLDLCEWNYGDYEGLTTAQIRAQVPDWSVWKDPLPNGETIDEVALRARHVIARAENARQALLFAHGHILRILAATWLGLEPRAGRFLALSTGSISVLGYEKDTPVISSWNLV